jgi:hypothetical protein
MSAVSAGFASGGLERRLNTGGSVRLIFPLSVSVLVAHLRPTLYVKLARMHRADLVTESPRENQDDRQGDHVHELCNHEHGITDDGRMSEKKR